MRKALLYSIAAALLLASLVGCSKDQQAAATPTTEQVETTTVPEQTESQDTTETPDAEQPDSTANQLSSTETPDTESAVEMTQEEVHSVFETMYLAYMNSIKMSPNVEFNMLLEREIDSVADYCDATSKKLPEDYAEQYKAWRESYKITKLSCVFTDEFEIKVFYGNYTIYSDIYKTEKLGSISSGDIGAVVGHGYDKAAGWTKASKGSIEGYIYGYTTIYGQAQQPESGGTQASEQKSYSFDSVSKTMYATGNVNIRTEPSASSTKYGSLATGDAIEVIGIGKGDAAGWMEVSIGGKVVYVSGSYLSDTKPVVSTSNNTGSGSQSSGNSQNQGNNSGYVDMRDPWVVKFGMTGDEIASLPDDQKIALGFTYHPDLGWRDSNGRSLPFILTEEEKALIDEANKGVTFG